MKISLQKRIAIVARALEKVAVKGSLPPPQKVLRATNSLKTLLEALNTENFLDKTKVQSHMVRLDSMLSVLKKEVSNYIDFDRSVDNLYKDKM